MEPIICYSRYQTYTYHTHNATRLGTLLNTSCDQIYAYHTHNGTRLWTLLNTCEDIYTYYIKWLPVWKHFWTHMIRSIPTTLIMRPDWEHIWTHMIRSIPTTFIMRPDWEHFWTHMIRSIPITLNGYQIGDTSEHMWSDLYPPHSNDYQIGNTSEHIMWSHLYLSHSYGYQIGALLAPSSDQIYYTHNATRLNTSHSICWDLYRTQNATRLKHLSNAIALTTTTGSSQW